MLVALLTHQVTLPDTVPDFSVDCVHENVFCSASLRRKSFYLHQYGDYLVRQPIVYEATGAFRCCLREKITASSVALNRGCLHFRSLHHLLNRMNRQTPHLKIDASLMNR